MQIFGMIFRDKLGWPVTTFIGFHPVTNLFRILIHTNLKRTWELRKYFPEDKYKHMQDCCNQSKGDTHGT